MRVAVIGAGIVGASIAQALALRGTEVTVLESAAVGAGATGTSFACLNAFGTTDPHYFALRQRALRHIRQMAEDPAFGDLIHLGSSLRWAVTPARQARLEQTAQRHLALGGRLERRAGKNLGGVPSDPVDAILLPDEGWLDPPALTARLLSAAADYGATPRTGTALRTVEEAADGIRLITSEGRMTVDLAVLAVGSDTARLTRALGCGLPIERHPGVLVWCRREEMRPRHVLYVDDLHLRAAPGGLVVVGESGHEQAAPPSPDQTDATARRILSRLDALFPPGRATQPEAARVGIRAVPEDGFPVIGTLPGFRRLYVVATHGGITLAPLLGPLCAAEIVKGMPDAQLAPYRPERFADVDATREVRRHGS